MATSALTKTAIAVLWTIAVYLSSLLTFVDSVPHQGMLSSAHWHLFFLIPSAVVSGIGVLALPNMRPGLGGAIRSAALAFISSATILAVQCGLSLETGSEQEAWSGIPALHLIFFAVVVAAIMGSLPIGRKGYR
jgi:hypothetical protein